jgi:hypothetical protein
VQVDGAARHAGIVPPARGGMQRRRRLMHSAAAALGAAPTADGVVGVSPNPGALSQALLQQAQALGLQP